MYTHTLLYPQTISKPEMLQRILMAVLGILVDGEDSTEDGNDEDEDLAEEMDTKCPYSSATKVVESLPPQPMCVGWRKDF